MVQFSGSTISCLLGSDFGALGLSPRHSFSWCSVPFRLPSHTSPKHERVNSIIGFPRRPGLRPDVDDPRASHEPPVSRIVRRQDIHSLALSDFMVPKYDPMKIRPMGMRLILL